MSQKDMLDSGELGKQYREVTEKTMELAGEDVMMSGLSAGSHEDKVSNWITYTVSWPLILKDIKLI